MPRPLQRPPRAWHRRPKRLTWPRSDRAARLRCPPVWLTFRRRSSRIPGVLSATGCTTGRGSSRLSAQSKIDRHSPNVIHQPMPEHPDVRPSSPCHLCSPVVRPTSAASLAVAAPCCR
jgi:hypothetical protein